MVKLEEYKKENYAQGMFIKNENNKIIAFISNFKEETNGTKNFGVADFRHLESKHSERK
jgi:hypothetical protein